jgi:hypothetical protein
MVEHFRITAMNKTRNHLLLLAGALALMLAGCGKDEPAAVADITPEARALLAYVPADTPFLAGNLAALPDEIIDLQFQRYAPVTAEAQKVLDDLRAELGAESSADPADRLALAVLSELDGKLSRAGLESLGVDVSNLQAIYGMGAFPVARISLSDAAALRATIQRVLANAGVTAEEHRLQDVAYWRAPLDEDDLPLALYAAVLPTHLALGVLPTGAEAELLPAFLGLELPAASDAAERLAALNARHGFTPYMTFTLDLHRLADEFLELDSVTVRALGAEAASELSGLDDTCAAEIHRILDKFPRFVGGVTELEPNATAFRGIVELPTELGGRLQALTAAVPALGDAADRVAEFAFGIKVGAARDFLRSEARAVVDNPFRCEQLADLNTQARDLVARLDQPLPPFVNNFRGFNFSLKTLDMDAESMVPRDLRGHAAVQVENPQMFVGMAQMFLPDLSEVQMAPGDDPVRVPEYLGSFQNIVAYAAISDDAIGVSLGEGEQDELAAYLARKAGPEGVLLAADYDSAALNRLQQRDLDEVLAQGGGANPFIGLARVASDTFEQVNDRHRVQVKFTAQGLVVDSRYTYK